MNKIGLKTILVCIVLLIGLVTLFACNKNDVADDDGQTKIIVKIQNEDGSVYKDNVVLSELFGQSLQKEGYTGKLYRDADFLKPLTKNSEVKNGDTIYVKWTINKYTVTFKDGETVLKTENVEHGNAATPPTMRSDAKAKFVGWDREFNSVTSDLTVNANWEKQKYTLTFIDHNGQNVYEKLLDWGTPVENEYYAAEDKISISDPFAYVGWYDNSDKNKTIIEDFSEYNMPTHNLTLVLKVRLADSVIGDFTVVNPKNFTYSENNSAEFAVTGKTYDGVTYRYEWTILKDNEVYKTETTDEQSLTIHNLSAGLYFAKVKIVASKADCGTVEKSIEAAGTLTVSRANILDVTVTVNPVVLTYGDKSAKIEISGLLATDVVRYGTDDVNFTLENVDLSALDAGEYGYYVRVDRGENYNPFTSGKITITINKAKVTVVVTPEKAELAYGDDLPSLTATIEGVKVLEIARDKYSLRLKGGETTITDGVASNVGEYEITGVQFSHENYPEKNYEITLETAGTITINKAALSVTIDKINALTYGAELPEITYTFDGLKLSDTEEDFIVSVVTEYKKKADAGDYTLTATISGEKTKYYEITVNTVAFKVNKKSASINVRRVEDIVYGDKAPDMSASVRGVLDGDSLSYTLETNYSIGAKPGYYNVNVVFDKNAEANKNYSISYSSSSFKVNKAALTISLSSVRVAVGKTYKVDADKLTIAGLVAGDTVTGYVEITKSEPGVYTEADFDKSDLVVKNADCYDISYDMSVEFVKVDFAIDFADASATYDGQEHGVSVTKTDDSKNYTITYGTTEDGCTLSSSPLYKNAGVYTIYFKVVDNDSTAGGAEYVGHVMLTINKAGVTVTVNPVVLTYGETPVFSYSVTGLVGDDKLSGEAVYGGAGVNAGEYDISLSGLSAGDNYKITFVIGKLTINKKNAEVVWNIAESYVYNPAGQILPTATYDGKDAILIFKVNGAVCEFKNAGEYTVTVADDENYILTGDEKTIVIEKARYTSAPALSLSGVYNPEKTLGNYALDEGFNWVNAGEIPVCTKTGYAAIYNKDRTNYEDFEVTVTLTLQKATVKLAQNVFEFNYDGTSHEISTTVTYNNVELTASLYTLSFDKKMFSDAGTHRTLVTMQADNYALPENSYIYVKVKGVKVGNTYYTIEDALFNAKSGDTIEIVDSAKEVSFAPLEIATAIYSDNAYRTIKAGVTLKLASDQDSSVKIGTPTYGAGAGNYVDTDSSKIKHKLILNESTVLEVYGNILVQGLLGRNGQGLSGHTSGNHSQIINNGKINLNSGSNLDLRGYIKGTGAVETRSGAIVYSPFVVYDYRGGTNTTTVYRKGNIAPFRIYEMPNIQCKHSIVYGAKCMGYLDLYASRSHKTDVATIIGNAKAMVIMEVATASIVTTYKKVDNGIGVTELTMTGKVKMGTLEITVSGVTVSMTAVRFPMPWNYIINVGDGVKQTTFTVGDNYKMMTGATVNVKKNATINLTGSVLIYKTYVDNAIFDPKYPNKGAAKLSVEGIINVTGGIAGEIFGGNGGKVIIGNNANLSITEKEGDSGDTSQISAILGSGTFYERATISEVATFVNADNTTVTAAKNKTYTYNNGGWQ